MTIWGYEQVYLSVDGNKTQMTVHQLVLTAFVGPRPECMEACHNDGNRRNNAVENLRWDTTLANVADKRKHGTQLFGERCTNAKLTCADIVAIRKLSKEGLSSIKISLMFPVNSSTVRRIIRGEAWSHVT